MPVLSNPTAVMINYSPPDQPNGLVTGYVVFFTSDNSQNDRDWAVEGVVGDKLTTLVRGLTPNTKYFFKIQARNSKGYGPLSPVVSYTTPVGDPSRSYSEGQSKKTVQRNSLIFFCYNKTQISRTSKKTAFLLYFFPKRRIFHQHFSNFILIFCFFFQEKN